MLKPKIYSPKSFNGKKFTKIEKKESASSKGYDSDWNRYRWRFLHHNPTCYICGLRKATQVDHIVPAKVDHETYFWKIDNYLGLCHSCHSTVTGKFDRHAVPKTEEKLEWIANYRKMNNVTIKCKVVQFKKGSGLGK